MAWHPAATQMRIVLHPWIWAQWTDVILGFDLSSGPVIREPRVPVRLEAIGPGGSVAAFRGFPGHLTRNTLRLRIGRGDMCVAAHHADGVIAYAWLATGPWRLRDAGLEVRLTDAEAVIYDLFTVSRHRGQGIMQAIVAQAIDVARGRGIDRLYSRADDTNRRSIAAMQSVGFAKVATISAVRVLRACGFYTIAIEPGEEVFLNHARQDTRLTRLGVLRWSGGGERGVRYPCRVG